MIISSGFFRNLFSTSWWITSQKDGINLSIGYEKLVHINYLDLGPISSVNSLFGVNLTISSQDKQITFEGADTEEAQKFIKEVKLSAGKAIAARIEKDSKQIEQASDAFEKLKSGDFYLNQSKIDQVRGLLTNSVRLFEHLYFNKSLLDSRTRAFAEEYKMFIDPLSKDRIARNKRYTLTKKEKYKNTFDHIERYPLTEEQRTAVVTEEDNVLLVAAAGSGKTSTIKAKIFYLLKESKYRANQLVVFAYNKDAQLELTRRIDELFNHLDWKGERVQARTFHGFSMDVLAKVNSEKPSISPIATGSQESQICYFKEIIDRIRINDTNFTEDLLTYFTVFKYLRLKKARSWTGSITTSI